MLLEAVGVASKGTYPNKHELFMKIGVLNVVFAENLAMAPSLAMISVARSALWARSTNSCAAM